MARSAKWDQLQEEPFQLDPFQLEPFHDEPFQEEPFQLEPFHDEPCQLEPFHDEPAPETKRDTVEPSGVAVVGAVCVSLALTDEAFSTFSEPKPSTKGLPTGPG